MSPEIPLESLILLPIALRSEYQKFTLENLSMLKKADSIREIFLHLNPLFSFIDYHLIKYLVEEFASTRLKRDTSAYVEAVWVFLDETTVLDLMDHWPGRRDIPPHFEELRAVIDGDPSKCLRSFYQREHIFSVTVGRQQLYSIAVRDSSLMLVAV